MAAPLRVGVVASGAPDGDRAARALAHALERAGHDAALVAAAPVPLLERVLDRRGFTGPLTGVPAATVGLARGRFDVAHALSPADALAARVWRRCTGGAVVFTCVERLDRDSVADGRLRLRLLAAALECSDAVAAADDAVRESLRRWMAVDAPLVPVTDAAANAELHRRAVSS